MSNSSQDRTILRELAEQVAEIAALPVQQETIALWKALNALKRGKPAAVLFESKALPTHERLHIEQALETATTAEEVRSAFADAPFCGELDWQGYP